MKAIESKLCDMHLRTSCFSIKIHFQYLSSIDKYMVFHNNLIFLDKKMQNFLELYTYKKELSFALTL